ncbi:response regulator [Terasakiella sp. SH-1]|uniref:response regulator n=1 Tax=Terasakiella sp. SH-1 TaxID=2560057 RepID=UPI0010743A61|nr:response regulator [Terasakiella sp. SH-1]
MSDRARMNFQKLTALVLERDEASAHIIKTYLENFGFQKVLITLSEEDFWDILNCGYPHILIMEYALQDSTTIDLVQKIRQADFESYQYAHILMVSAVTDISSVSQARDVGVNEFLVKPFSARSLYSHIVSLITHPKPFINGPTYKGPDRRCRHYDVSIERRKR